MDVISWLMIIVIIGMGIVLVRDRRRGLEIDDEIRAELLEDISDTEYGNHWGDR